ncbi:antibiotic biosynthesis monooxygenase [Undibacterium sp. Jales W-56]|uniref:antibiotic biosynthesis monooxygenase family protein n=1 Tax=Undibacterium sp. Jales W-56 TaxID=2897325 RepID=UPI0021D1BCD1|nr:antibiotic biosynthesis monooxygenase family protein [Undibacterium sp. Jales W-56]MCU6433795.1 antibiotic biosynthesis monooxygenase [Undibacterium sp. Jales W-56]
MQIKAHQSGATLTERCPGFIVLYRWRLHPGSETAFIEAWTRISALLLAERGSLGSRLHKGEDGIWYSYAQWPSAAARTAAFGGESLDAAAAARMRAAIAENFPEVILEPVSDMMLLANEVQNQSI